MEAARAWELLQALVGNWQGRGVGSFPTIEDFSYRETLSVEGGSEYDLLRFSQTSWRLTPEGETESHSESGFIGVTDDGRIEIAVAEGLDRLELLSGHLTQREEGILIEVASTEVAHDERVLRSWRTLALQGEELTYTMGMATTQIPNGENHLTGALRRQ